MPKPFKRKGPQVVHVTPIAVVIRPLLAIDIANIASNWTKLEHTLSLPFTTILAGQEPSAFEAYHELFEINLRHKMYIAAAKRKKLPKELLTEAEILHKKVRKVGSRRNNVVHGTWAYCDDLPNSLLLCEPSALNRQLDEFFAQFHDRVELADEGKVRDSWSFDLSIDDFEEYSHDDFGEITKSILETDAVAFAYWRKVASFSLQHERERRLRRRSR